MHGSKFPHIIVDNTVTICKNELDVVMFFLFVFFVIPNILALHPEVGNDRVILEFKDEMLAVSVDVCEGLTDEGIDKIHGVGLLDDVWVEGFYCS